MKSAMLDLEVTPLPDAPAWPEGGREPRHVAFTYPVAPAKWTAADLRAVMAKAAQLVPACAPVPVFQSMSWSDEGGFELAMSVGADGHEFAATVRADRDQVSAEDRQRVGGVRWALMFGRQEAARI